MLDRTLDTSFTQLLGKIEPKKPRLGSTVSPSDELAQPPNFILGLSGMPLTNEQLAQAVIVLQGAVSDRRERFNALVTFTNLPTSEYEQEYHRLLQHLPTAEGYVNSADYVVVLLHRHDCPGACMKQFIATSVLQ